MRLPNNRHYEFPWRVHELATDFRLEDLWEFPITADTRQGHGEWSQSLLGVGPQADLDDPEAEPLRLHLARYPRDFLRALT